MNNQTIHKRIYGLDILRAIAITYVMHVHGKSFLEPHINYSWYGWLMIDGVDLFFVLSGFLIGGILLRTIAEGTFTAKKLWQFWIRRWFRTLPNYFLVLIVLISSYQLFMGDACERPYEYFLFIQNFNKPHPSFFSAAWSLSVEEWFYLLVPAGFFILLKIQKNNRQKMILSWICLVIIAVVSYRTYRVYNLQPGEDYDLPIRREVLTRLDSIMYGVLGAYISYYYKELWLKRVNLSFFTGLVILFGSRIYSDYNLQFNWYGLFIANGIGTLLLLPRLSTITGGRGIAYRSFTLISIVSYSMYLLNQRLHFVVTKLFAKAGLDTEKNMVAGIAAYIAFWLLTIGCSYLLYRYFEKPMTKLRDRFRSKRNDPEPAPAVPNNTANARLSNMKNL